MHHIYSLDMLRGAYFSLNRGRQVPEVGLQSLPAVLPRLATAHVQIWIE